MNNAARIAAAAGMNDRWHPRAATFARESRRMNFGLAPQAAGLVAAPDEGIPQQSGPTPPTPAAIGTVTTPLGALKRSLLPWYAWARSAALLLGLLCLGAADAADLKTAALEGNSRSLRMYESQSFVPGLGTVTLIFTSYDGNTGFPRHQDTGDGIFFNYELQPAPGEEGETTYVTDWLNYARELADPWIAWGFYGITLPTTDINGNGLDDFGEVAHEANVTFSGFGRQEYPSTGPIEFTGRLLRPAGAFVGTWETTNSISGFKAQGKWEIPHFVGSAAYERGALNTLQLSLKIDNPSFGPQETFTGATNYTIVSENEITLPSFAIRAPSGSVQNILGPFRFVRLGNRYVGNMEMFDGVLETHWRDYVHHVVEITDLNDSDFDGIPDLSDLAHVPANVLTLGREGGALSITWPLTAAGFALQWADSPLPDADWQDVAPPPATTGGSHVVQLEIEQGTKFFRLKK